MSLDFNLDRYLERLGLASLPAGDGRRLACAGPPSVEGLRILHHAHVERVPYENLDIQLGRPMSIGPLASAARIAAGRGGYCYQLNGAFGLLLGWIGTRVLEAMQPPNMLRVSHFSVDGTVLAFVTAVSCMSGMLFAIAPALRARRRDPAEALSGGSRGGTQSRRTRRWGDALVVSEVAIALMLTVGAGLLGRRGGGLHVQHQQCAVGRHHEDAADQRAAGGAREMRPGRFADVAGPHAAAPAEGLRAPA